MKQEMSPLPRARDSDYVVHPIERFPYKTLNDVAEEMGISSQRCSRILRILQIPVHRAGYVILLDALAQQKVAREVENCTIQPGRKKERGE